MVAFAQIAALTLAAHTPAGGVETAAMGQAYGTQELVEGRESAAIQAIREQGSIAQQDPALLINLAIAHARRGDTARAREFFEAALAHRDRIELETAAGRWENSRALARKGIAMLDRGEFASTASIASR